MSSFYQKMARAFDIFNSYEGDQYLSAEHDIIYSGPSPAVVTAEHCDELYELGWYKSEEYDSFYCFV